MYVQKDLALHTREWRLPSRGGYRGSRAGEGQGPGSVPSPAPGVQSSPWCCRQHRQRLSSWNGAVQSGGCGNDMGRLRIR